MKERMYFEYNYSEMERLIMHTLRPGDAQEFSIVAMEESSNDMCKAYHIHKGAQNDHNRNQVEEFIRTGKWSTWNPGMYAILEYMVDHDMLPEGNYLIEISW